MSLNGLIAARGVVEIAIIVMLLLLLYGLFIHLGGKFVKADYSDYGNSVAVAAASMLLAGVFSFAFLGVNEGWGSLSASALIGTVATWLVAKFAFETNLGGALLIAVFAQVSMNVAALALIVLGVALAPLFI